MDTLPVDGRINLGLVPSAYTRITSRRCSGSALANEQIRWGKTYRLNQCADHAGPMKDMTKRAGFIDNINNLLQARVKKGHVSQQKGFNYNMYSRGKQGFVGVAK